VLVFCELEMSRQTRIFRSPRSVSCVVHSPTMLDLHPLLTDWIKFLLFSCARKISFGRLRLVPTLEVRVQTILLQLTFLSAVEL